MPVKASVLKILEENPGKSCSGEEIAGQLSGYTRGGMEGCARTSRRRLRDRVLSLAWVQAYFAWQYVV